MPDKKSPNSEPDDLSPSTLFLEMMRQAAARRAEQGQSPVIEANDSADDADSASTDTTADDAPSAEPADEPSLTYDDTRAIHTRPATFQPPNVPADEPDLPDVSTADSPPDDHHDAEADPAPPPADPTLPKRPLGRVPIYQAPDIDDDERQAKLEEQRIRRLRRRRERRRKRRVGMIGGFIRTIFISVFAAALASTIFTWFTDPAFINPIVANRLPAAVATERPQAVPVVQASPTVPPVTPNYLQRIGIVSGHRGPENDPGAICPDGLTEAEINFDIAQRLTNALIDRGYVVDLLDEFDPRLENYRASALVSLHSNDCRDYGPDATAFLVSRAAARPVGGADDALAECIALYYARSTELERRFTLTLDMTDYHTFREIHALTPAAILEMGFMRNDRELLTQRQDVIVTGLINGIECFLRGENAINIASPTPRPRATATATPVP
jgi:N-acetylmuramoyl-L-alanine amidase